MGRIFKRGRSWYIDCALKGRRIRKSVGPSRRVAELALRDIELKSARGEYLGIYEDKRVLFEDFAERYLTFSKANKAPKSYGRDLTSLRTNLIPHFRGYYLFDISSQMVEDYKSLRLSGVKPATLNRELACLRHMYNKAIEWGYVGRNPMQGVKLLKEPPERLRFLSPEEIEALLQQCSVYLRSIVITAVHTGMRKSEVLGLTWSQVDLRERTIALERTKANERRVIPINDVLLQELRSIPLRLRSDFVFCKKNGDPYGDIGKGFKAAVRRAGIEDFRFHDLRHTFASHLVMSGVDLRTVQQLLGHKTMKMTVRYSHLSKAHLQEAVNRLGTNLAQGRTRLLRASRKSL